MRELETVGEGTDLAGRICGMPSIEARDSLFETIYFSQDRFPFPSTNTFMS